MSLLKKTNYPLSLSESSSSSSDSSSSSSSSSSDSSLTSNSSQSATISLPSKNDQPTPIKIPIPSVKTQQTKDLDSRSSDSGSSDSEDSDSYSSDSEGSDSDSEGSDSITKQELSDDKYKFLYPILDDPSFNIKIAEKKEFNDNKYDGKIYDLEKQAEKLCNSEFELQPHQLFVRNFLSFNTPYNSLLLFHGLGTGKTCSAIGVCEEMRDYMKQMGFNQRIIIVASPNVQENFKLQLFDERKLKLIDGLWNLKACTGNKFIREINPMNMEGLTKEKIISQIKRIINNFYLFMGYTEFSNYISKKAAIADESLSSEKIDRIKIKKLKSVFNNRLIVIDEVQNIRISNDNKNKKIAINLMKLASVVDNLRLLLLSATPMYNSYKEIVWLINLMNKNDKRSEINLNEIFDKSGNFKLSSDGKEIGKELLMQKATGYVSFIRGENPYTFPYRIWPQQFDPSHSLLNNKIYPRFQLNKKPIIQGLEHLDLYTVNIGSIQEIGYNYIIDSINSSKIDIPNFENMDSFGYTLLTQPLEALNIIYPIQNISTDLSASPEQLTGKIGLRRIMNYVESRVGGKEERYNYDYKPEILKEFGNIFSLDLIGKYSCKIKNIVESIKSGEGIVLVYSQYLEGGLVPIALALEEIGFKKFGNTHNLLKSNPNTNTGKYIMITGDKFYSPDNVRDLKAITSEDNSNGEKIKVVLISKAGSEGLDFKNIRQVHILEPWYNTNRIEQIIGRAVRTCSHKLLPFQERNVSIYLYGTILEENINEAVDLYIYRLAEIKAVQIGKVTRVLKQSSVDCILNHEQTQFTEENFNKTVVLNLSNKKNIQYKIGDKPFTALCDYMESCSYKCIPNKKITKINLDTYDETFILLNNDRIIQRIKNLFKERYIYKKNKLITSINVTKNYPLMQIYSALNQLVQDKNEFLIDKYGRIGYLINIGEYYMYQPAEINSDHISTYDRNRPIDFKKNKLIIKQDKKPNKSIKETKNPIIDPILTLNLDTDKEVIDLIKKLESQYNLTLTLQPISRGEDNWYKFCSHVIIQMEKQGINKSILLDFVLAHQVDTLAYKDKLQLMNYLYFTTNTLSTYENKLKKYIDSLILKNDMLSGLFIQKEGKYVLLIKDKSSWTEGKDSSYKDLAQEIKKMIDNVLPRLNYVIGFINTFKKNELVFKTKDFSIKRSKGARCDQAGKKGNNGVIKTLNKILEEEKYTEANTKGIYALQLCVLEELTLRYFNKTNHKNKIWFLGPEKASLLNIESFQK